MHISHARKHYVSVVYCLVVHQCYIAVVRPYVEWVEACIYLSMDKSRYKPLFITNVRTDACVGVFLFVHTGFCCSILHGSTQYSRDYTFMVQYIRMQLPGKPSML